MREFAIIMLALALEPQPSLVILTPEGREPGDRAAILSAYTSARAWWGFDKSTPLVSIQAMPPDALSSPPVYTEGTVVVIDSQDLLLGKYRGLAAPGRIWVVSGAFHLEAVLAHEMGHAYFGLEHWPDCIGIDIMCAPDAAYPLHSIGCRSLAALGRPCAHVYLPEVS